jgi:hypothetical protein
MDAFASQSMYEAWTVVSSQRAHCAVCKDIRTACAWLRPVLCTVRSGSLLGGRFLDPIWARYCFFVLFKMN